MSQPRASASAPGGPPRQGATGTAGSAAASSTSRPAAGGGAFSAIQPSSAISRPAVPGSSGASAFSRTAAAPSATSAAAPASARPTSGGATTAAATGAGRITSTTAATSRSAVGAGASAAAPGMRPAGGRPYSTASQGLDVRQAISSYFERIISAVQGMKVVLLDDEAKTVVSMVYTQSQILEKSVFLTASLTPKPKVMFDETTPVAEPVEHEKMLHLKGLILCRPTEENIKAISKHLDEPLYGEYHIFFTTPVHPSVLSLLAQKDRTAVVKQMQEFYIDYLAVNADLFDFAMQGYLELSLKPKHQWRADMEAAFKRSVQQTLAVLLSLRQKPTVRYQSGSELAGMFAQKLHSDMVTEAQLFDFGNAAPPSNSSGQTLLLVLDRKEDPITPLLLQWTYQAMVHEYVGSGLQNNVVDLGDAWLKRNPDADEQSERDPVQRAMKAEQRRRVVMTQSDEFYSKNMFKDYGVVTKNAQNLFNEYKETVKQNKNLTSIEDMTRVVENMAEFKKIASNVIKHNAVMNEIGRVVTERHLYEVGLLEQSIACSNDHATHVEMLRQKIKDPKLGTEDKMRLALLYTLRYETHGGNRIPEIKQLLRTNHVGEDKVKMVDAILSYAGSSKRNQLNYGAGADLFAGFVSMVKNVTAGQTGVENALIQHKPMLAKILEEARTGKLSEAKYPAVAGPAMPSATPPPGGHVAPPAKEVIVLILGGATYEEAAYVANLNANPATAPFKVLLGGTSIHNTKTFLDAISG